MLKRLLLVLALASLAAAQAPGPNVNSGRFMAANYGQWQVTVQSTPMGKACVSPVTVTLADGSKLDPWNTNASILIGSGANAETVTPTAFDFLSSPGQVCISGTYTKTHFFGDPVSSGTFGLQEALNAAGVKGGGAVTIDQNWTALGGTTAIKGAASLPSNVLIEDIRTGVGSSVAAAVGWHRQGTVLAPNVPADQGNLFEADIIYEANCPLLSGILSGTSCFRAWMTSGWSAGGVTYAESLDGFQWQRSLTIAPSGHAHVGVAKSGSTYYLVASNALGVATGVDVYSSTTGNQDWSLVTANIITRGGSGAFDQNNLGNVKLYPAGVLDGTSTWYIFYDGLSAAGNWAIGVATCTTSCPGGTWTKFTGSGTGGSVISESNSISGSLDIHKVGSTYYGWAHGEITGGPAVLPSDLFRYTATSVTGPWTHSPAAPTLQRSTLDEGPTSANGQIFKPRLIEVNGNTYMFYGASANGNSQSGQGHLKLAQAEMPIASLITTNEGPAGPGKNDGLNIVPLDIGAAMPGFALQGIGPQTAQPNGYSGTNGSGLFWQNFINGSSNEGYFAGFNYFLAQNNSLVRYNTTRGGYATSCTAGTTDAASVCFRRFVAVAGTDLPVHEEAVDSSTKPFEAALGRFKITDQGTCTMTTGTCSAQSLTSTYTTAPNCIITWNGTGTLTGILKAPSTTTTVTPASSVGTDTAVVNWICFGN